MMDYDYFQGLTMGNFTKNCEKKTTGVNNMNHAVGVGVLASNRYFLYKQLEKVK